MRTYEKPMETMDTVGRPIQEGDDFVCPNCGCEIRLRHAGDPAKMQSTQPFTCRCGTPMEPEAQPGS
jgi:predicted RNA-binding Zn-ribbon protein involved in translation (DUF1610 family)